MIKKDHSTLNYKKIENSLDKLTKEYYNTNSIDEERYPI